MLQRVGGAVAGFGLGLDLIERRARRNLGERHPAAALLVDGEDAEVGDDHVDDAGAGERQRAALEQLASFLAECSITTTTFLTPATRSMAPPMPLTILPGIIQLARSPFSATCMAPRMERSMCPPRIMAKLSADEK